MGEIEMTEDEIQEVLPALSKFIFELILSDDLAALLSVVAVNLAFYSEENSNGFRPYVLRSFGFDPNETLIWEDQIGTPVLRLLKEQFQAEEKEGPYKYVRPILEQAGVSARSRQQFVDFFLALINSCGDPFSLFDFRKFKDDHRVQSSSLNYFLSTDAGWRYSREVAQKLRNLNDRLLEKEEIEHLPPRFRETIRVIKQKLEREAPEALKEENIPAPSFALDKSLNRLAARFSEKGINGLQSMYSLSDRTPILQTLYYLGIDELKQSVLRGNTRQRNGKRTGWELPLWLPSENDWAVFDVGSGSFVQSGGLLRPGEYLIVAKDGITGLESLEDYGYLDLPHESVFRILHVDLRIGFSLPEIGLRVGGSAASSPSLRFNDKHLPLRFTDNVFVGRTPSIDVLNWSEETAARYLLTVDDGNRRRKVTAQQLGSGRILEERILPYRAEAQIEPLGKSTRSDRLVPLAFTVLPSNFTVRWDDELYQPGDQPVLEFGDASLVWDDGSLEKLEGERYKVRPNVNLLRTRLGVGENFSFPLTIPVYRFLVSGPPIKDDLVWQDVLTKDGKFEFTFSKNERQHNVELGLWVGDRFVKIADSPKVPDHMRLTIATVDIRDAFSDCHEVAGFLAARLRCGKVVSSNILYINDQRVIELTLDSSYKAWCGILPPELKESLDSVRDFARLGGEGTHPIPNFWIPDPLREWIRSFKPDLNGQRQLLRDWCAAIRTEQWDSAQASVLGQEQIGNRLVEAAREYRRALARPEGSSEYRNFLIAAFRKFDNLLTTNDLRTQLARHVRLLCCVRLNRREEFEAELEKLGPEWDRVKTELSNRMYLRTKSEPVSGLFEFDDLIIHANDF